MKCIKFKLFNTDVRIHIGRPNWKYKAFKWSSFVENKLINSKYRQKVTDKFIYIGPVAIYTTKFSTLVLESKYQELRQKERIKEQETFNKSCLKPEDYQQYLDLMATKYNQKLFNMRNDLVKSMTYSSDIKGPLKPDRIY